MDLNQGDSVYKPAAAQGLLSARLAAINAEINALTSAPAAFGGAGPRRRRLDTDILQGLAADVFARLAESEGQGQ